MFSSNKVHLGQIFVFEAELRRHLDGISYFESLVGFQKLNTFIQSSGTKHNFLLYILYLIILLLD